MSKLDDIRDNISSRGKSLLVTVADIIESVTKQNLALASDVAGFAVDQVRLPTQVDDLGDYRDRSKDAFSKLGGQLKGHGKDLITVLREVPGQVKDALSAETPVAKPKAVKKTVKKAVRKAVKKPVVKKAPAKKAAAKKEVVTRKAPARKASVKKEVVAKKAPAKKIVAAPKAPEIKAVEKVAEKAVEKPAAAA